MEDLLRARLPELETCEIPWVDGAANGRCLWRYKSGGRCPCRTAANRP